MGIFGSIKSFFSPKQTTTSTALDPASQAYVNQMRMQAQNASGLALNQPGSFFAGPQTMSIGDQAAQFFNPYMQNVVNATQGQYDQLRSQALSDTSRQATQAGAYGGSRAAVLAGSRLGALDIGQANTIGNLLNSGYQNALGQGTQYSELQRQLHEQQLQEPLFRAQQAQQFQNFGLGPYSQTTTNASKGGGFGDLLKTGIGLYTAAKGAGLFGGGQTQNLGMGGGYAMPQWQPPQWNPQYMSPYGR